MEPSEIMIRGPQPPKKKGTVEDLISLAAELSGKELDQAIAFKIISLASTNKDLEKELAAAKIEIAACEKITKKHFTCSSPGGGGDWPTH